MVSMSKEQYNEDLQMASRGAYALGYDDGQRATLKWTTEAPTEPGMFLWQMPIIKTVWLVDVRSDGYFLRFTHPLEKPAHNLRVGSVDGQWFGPIPEPQ